MFTRRAFSFGLAGTALLKVPGCDGGPVANPALGVGAVDIHSHIFNGRDLPAVGFLRQVVIRDPHTPPDADMLTDAFLLLLKDIMLSGTPTATQELARLNAGAGAQGQAALAAQDRDNVATGIARFQRTSQQSFTAADRGAANRILDRLAAELAAPGLRDSLMTPEQQAGTLADLLYKTGQPGGFSAGDDRAFTLQSPFLQTIRWAGLLTRARYDLMATLDGLYGGAEHIRVFTPSLVDLGSWLLTAEDATPIAEQIEVTSAIARTYGGALVLPFVAFCPLRAVRDRAAGREPLRNVRHAVLERGFVGVKLYPPMGFRPIGNDETTGNWLPDRPADLGRKIDAELGALYAWCVAHDVPITAHANRSMGAGPDTAEHADPDYWKAVLDRPALAGLRLNLAHYGGFDETGSPAALGSSGDWEETLGDMIGSYAGVYFDLGYWTEASDPTSPDHARVIERTRQLIDRHPLALERMMYGSDWSMIGREPSHKGYLAGVERSLSGDLALAPDKLAGVMGRNAMTFLGLDRAGKQRDRVAAFHGAHPLYAEIFDP
ncbi:amidohydrolase family protein [Defluviimonas denitrificans]|jgi:predicted TIM-barrel fold metal-dependent hydrolase|uniref:Amidohydrolase family protein n=1 Tax=Albidovulum denitrificans TaxID=404881 RepID=A0A2S8S9G2_9RHOB|nr:amidohydrolase family protein [Defluviimonas denitrificans]PQV57413.1 amidohydrolase family protein [Defluviimonas denitrificans]